MSLVYTIENEFYTVQIQGTGAELCSFYSKKTGTEYMWSANPKVWASHAPVLFPIIGCLKDGFCYIDNKSYVIPKHGIVRNNNDLIVDKKDRQTVSFSLSHSTESLKIYPYLFEFEVCFHLEGNRLLIEHTIVNKDHLNTLFFSLGGHPAFKCPFHDGESYSDYYVEFDNIENDFSCEVDCNGLIGDGSNKLLDNTDFLSLSPSMFSNDALIFKNLRSKRVFLKSHLHNVSLELAFPDFDYLAFWAKPNAAFICIEPWLGISDSVISNQQFIEKEGIQKLEPSSTKKYEFSISLSE
jgi:galactose mutarotase-like enzyme